MEDLLVWVVERVAKMPREHKFTVGDRLVEACLEVSSLLVEDRFSREQLPVLAAAWRGLTRAHVPVWVARNGWGLTRLVLMVQPLPEAPRSPRAPLAGAIRAG